MQSRGRDLPSHPYGAEVPALAPEPWRLLGGLLVAQGLIRRDELEWALGLQQETGKKLGEILIESGRVSRSALAAALASQYGVDFQEESGYGTGLLAEIERRAPVEAEPVPAALIDLVPRLEQQPPPPPRPEPDFTEQRLAESAERLAQLTAALEAQDALLGRLEPALTDATQRLAEIEFAFEAHSARAAELAPKLTGCDAQLAAAEAALADGEQRLAELERLTRELAPRLDERERRFAELEPALAAQDELLARLAGQTAAVSELVQKLVGIRRAAPQGEPAMVGIPPAAPQGEPVAFDLQALEIDYGLARHFPEVAARSYTALPVAIDNGVVVVAVADTADGGSLEAVQALLGRQVRFVGAERGALLDAITSTYGPARRMVRTDELRRRHPDAWDGL